MILSLFHKSSGRDSVCHRCCVYFATVLAAFAAIHQIKQTMVKKNKGTVLILKIAIAAGFVCVCVCVCACVRACARLFYRTVVTVIFV